jgi:hypothetical protein
MSSIIFTDQRSPSGGVIRYNVDRPTRAVAQEVESALANCSLVEVLNEDGGEPIFVNPDHVVTVSPAKEDN